MIPLVEMGQFYHSFKNEKLKRKALVSNNIVGEHASEKRDLVIEVNGG